MAGQRGRRNGTGGAGQGAASIVAGKCVPQAGYGACRAVVREVKWWCKNEAAQGQAQHSHVVGVWAGWGKTGLRYVGAGGGHA